MKRLLLPITILFATVLGSISSVTFAQTPDDSQSNSPNPEASDNPQPSSPNPEASDNPQPSSPNPEAIDNPQPSSPTPEATDNPTPNSDPSPQEQGGYMGIQMVTLAPKTIEQINNSPDIDFKVPDTQGILIVQVLPNTPAAVAGLRPGDVVTEVSGKSTTTAKEIIDIVSKTSAGESLNLKVQRGEEMIPVSVELGEKPAK